MDAVAVLQARLLAVVKCEGVRCGRFSGTYDGRSGW